MLGLTERFFVFASRVCAAAVAAVPLAVLALLVWALFHQRGDVAGGDWAARAAFTAGVAAAAALAGGLIGGTSALAAHELASPSMRAAIVFCAGVLAFLPAAALGWWAFAAVPWILRATSALVPIAGAVAFLSIAAAPAAWFLTMAAIRDVPNRTRLAAAAAGATRAQTMQLVVMPSQRGRIAGIFAGAFTLAVSEATAMQILFFALAVGGVHTTGTTAGWILGELASSTTAPPGLVSSALLLGVVATACCALFARKQGDLRWA